MTSKLGSVRLEFPPPDPPEPPKYVEAGEYSVEITDVRPYITDRGRETLRVKLKVLDANVHPDFRLFYYLPLEGRETIWARRDFLLAFTRIDFEGRGEIEFPADLLLGQVAAAKVDADAWRPAGSDEDVLVNRIKTFRPLQPVHARTKPAPGWEGFAA